ncbi:MAG: PHP domain-containing protein [Calditrichaeota bacterium]|nr:PHP domain-containing protein [Calditrichota bacterium]
MLTRQRVDFSGNRIDLHIHSNHSDGNLSVDKIFAHAQKMKLKAISITDHDNISALPAANKLSQKKGIEFVNGIEISARGNKQDMHLLGYLFNYNDKSLIDYIEFFKNERTKRAKKIIKNFNNLGFDLTFEDVLKAAGKNASIGRPHIAYALINKGLATSFQEIFRHFLGDGCSCWVPKFKITPQDAISLIKSAHGICVLAHPDREISDEEICSLAKVGLDGIETLHPKHTQEEVDHFRQIAREKNLLESGGSDCHAAPGNGVHIGQLNVPYHFLEKMKERAGV